MKKKKRSRIIENIVNGHAQEIGIQKLLHQDDHCC